MDATARVKSPRVSVDLTGPVIALVLAATAVPIDVRTPHLTQIGLVVYPVDVLLNVIGYAPVGFVLAISRGSLRAGVLGATITLFAEASQLFMVHRNPSMVDVGANVVGALLGVIAAKFYRLTCARLTLDRATAAIAAALALALLLDAGWQAPMPLNERGWTRPGRLEAHWSFDETGGREATDSSGHRLDGAFNTELRRVSGIHGNAAIFDGATNYMDAGRASAFRLVGSMTVSAWIQIVQFPPDDAAIVSDTNGVGFQLDVTPDRGFRSIGFKLGNACGQLMARYGATSLEVGKWYHVAAIYDASARTLDVYLNGKLDNGFLLGTVTSTQHASREALYVGRRASERGYEFDGLIDDVRIYSRALTATEIDGVMRGQDAAAPPDEPSARAQTVRALAACAGASDKEDARLPGVAGVMGVLVAVMCLGFWPAAGRTVLLLAAVAGGLLLIPMAAPSLPPIGRCFIPLTSLATAVTVLASLSDA